MSKESDPRTDFSIGPATIGFVREIREVLRAQPDYRGDGGHGPENHHGGLHSQINIGMGEGKSSREINFRIDIPE